MEATIHSNLLKKLLVLCESLLLFLILCESFFLNVKSLSMRYSNESDFLCLSVRVMWYRCFVSKPFARIPFSKFFIFLIALLVEHARQNLSYLQKFPV